MPQAYLTSPAVNGAASLTPTRPCPSSRRTSMRPTTTDASPPPPPLLVTTAPPTLSPHSPLQPAGRQPKPLPPPLLPAPPQPTAVPSAPTAGRTATSKTPATPAPLAKTNATVTSTPPLLPIAWAAPTTLPPTPQGYSQRRLPSPRSEGRLRRPVMVPWLHRPQHPRVQQTPPTSLVVALRLRYTGNSPPLPTTLGHIRLLPTTQHQPTPPPPHSPT